MAARAIATLGLMVGFGAIILQAVLSFPVRLEQGRGLLDATIWFFTYFTILTNLMLVLIYLSVLVGWRWLGWWRSPVTRAMMAAAIALVLGFYHVVLSKLWAPQGAFLLADTVLHYVTPALYILWWLLFQPKGSLRWGDIGWMLVPPAIWLAWTMLRGAVVNEYPYPILEAHRLGYGAVALNILVVLAILVVLFVTTVGIDRLAARSKAAPGS
ncbi:MAG TPA: Pr6Pr family membrane protein [Alphaproteobacteria bacterium]|nr:Pr6Pr family membrane protein [Alphaproteobacteria bacterium]